MYKPNENNAAPTEGSSTPDPFQVQNSRFRFLLKEERLARGLTQLEMGQLLYVSPSYISSLEKGRRKVSARVLNSFHQLFQYSYDYLLNDPLKSADYVREPHSTYGMEDRFQSLLSDCTHAEREVCYRICQSYLLTKRSEEAASSPKNSEKKPLL